MSYESDFKIYPNPVKEITSIRLNIKSASNVKVEAIDYTGKRVQVIMDRPLPQDHSKISWNAAELAAGIYFVKVSVGNSNVVAQKVIVQ